MKYLFVYDKGRRFFLLSLFAVIPCAAAAYVFPLSNIIHWFIAYTKIDVSFGVFWLSFFGKELKYLWAFLIGFVGFIFAIATISTIISRHVRVGQFSLPNLFVAVNENFLPAVHLSISFVLFSAITHTLICLLLYLWSMLASTLLAVILSLISTLALLALVLYSYATLTLWLPIMSFNGLPVFRALSTAFYKSRSNQRYFYLFQLLNILFLLAATVLAYFVKSVRILSWLVSTLGYVFFFLLQISGYFIIYFEVESITREDLAKYRYYRR